MADHADESVGVGQLSGLRSGDQTVSISDSRQIRGRPDARYLGVPLQGLGLGLSVLHVQDVLVPGVVVRTQQLRQRVVELCGRQKLPVPSERSADRRRERSSAYLAG